MLRIESYITPIILSYVDKYIKNLKPEDSQVSLWGGDAVFSNLDLKLDVLEHDLRLPFSLVNGHIHELRIHVPWTKLTSEPIVITINTIECILKLRDIKGNEEESTGFENTTPDSSATDFRKKQRRQDIETPTSYIQGLINKIINNVSVVCNNVILKYVEDDIVLSINAKSLELQSVDGNWIPSFIDLTPEDMVLRNNLNLTDLTVCLDKRSAAGKIEVYQEPFLYRCSLSCRIIRKFESMHSFQPKDTRYDIYCPQLHFSLSDTQLPMFLRLVELFLALYSKRLQYQPQESSENNIMEKDENDEYENESNDDEESWSAWAWSLGSLLNPFLWDENDSLSQNQQKIKLHSTLQFGIYVKMATWVFKLTESVQDKSYFGPTKMQFTPFLRVTQQGSFFSALMKGLGWVNVEMGISSVQVDPVGRCICGLLDSEEKTNMAFIHCGAESDNYMSNSLFEEDEVTFDIKSDTDLIWESHFNSSTEESIMEKTSAFGMDYLYVMKIPPDTSSEKLSEINSNPECSVFEERGYCRFFFGALKIKFSSGFYHRVSTIIHGLRQSDYLPYASVVKGEAESESMDPSEEEIDHIESMCPLRTYTVVCCNLLIEFYMAQHHILDIKNVFTMKRKRKSRKSNSEMNSSFCDPVPSLSLNFGRIEIEYTIPMYLNRLNCVVAYLKHPSPKMLFNSHSHMSFKFIKCSASLRDEEKTSVDIIQNFSFVIHLKTLLNPLLSSYEKNTVLHCSINSEEITCLVNVPQLHFLYCFTNSWMIVTPSPEELKKHSLVSDAIKNVDSFARLKLEVQCIEFKLCKTTSAYSGYFTIGNVSLAFRSPKESVFYYVANGPDLKTSVDTFTDLSESEKLIKCAFQLPIENEKAGISTIFSFHVLKVSALLDPQLISCLKYRPSKCYNTAEETSSEVNKQNEIQSSSKLSRKSSEFEGENVRKETTSTTISDRKSLLKSTSEFQENVESTQNKSWKEKFIDILPLINNLVISIEIESWIMFLPNQPIKITSRDGLTNAVHRIYLTRGENSFLGDTSVICFPNIVLQNSTRKLSSLNPIYEIPISQQLYWVEDKLPWSLKLSNFNLYSLQGVGESVKLPILKPVNTTATFAVSPKTMTPSVSQASIVIHLDMSSLNFYGNRRQVETHATICERFLSLVYFYMPEQAIDEDLTIDQEDSINAKEQAPKNNSQVHDTTRTKNFNDNSTKTTNLPQYHDTNKELDSVSNKYQYEPGKSSIVDNSVSVALEDNNSPGQGDQDSQVRDSNSVSVTSWVQWTVASVSLSIFTTSGKESKKLKAEIEDLTMWVDLHQVYSKIKCKIANLNVLHYVKRNFEWVEGEMEGVIMAIGYELTKDVKVVSPSVGTPQQQASKPPTGSAPAPLLDHASSRGFLSLTFTVAQCKNIHNKWNQMIKKHLREEKYIKECNSPQFLSEVDLRLQPFDVVFYPSTLQPFAFVCEPWMDLLLPRKPQSASQGSKSTFVGQSLNNKVLPLMYVQTEPIRVFLPSTKASDHSNNQNVILMQIDSVIISPQVDNPLSRVVLRQDIFTTAEQSRILGVPGSEVEDRQYQLDLYGFSISTGSWHNIKRGRPRSLSAERLKVRSENPAFEWNNYDLSTEMEVVMYPLITRLDTRIIAAPAIVYNTFNEEIKADEELLIAGHSLEINATTDCSIYASLDQITLSTEICEGIVGFISHIRSRKYGNFNTSLSSDLDSGVDCETSSLDTSKTGTHFLHQNENFGKSEICSFVPLEVLITGSKITLYLFEKGFVEGSSYPVKKNRIERKQKMRERHKTSEVASTESEFSPQKTKEENTTPKSFKVPQDYDTAHQLEAGYEGSEEESVCEPLPSTSTPHMRILPLLFVDVSQPHTFLSLQSSKQKFELSCFDFVVKSIPKGFSIKVADAKNLPVMDDYTIPWLETRPGDCHPKTGIPPAFLTFSICDFLHQPAQVFIHLGRPFRLCFSQSKLEQIHQVVSSVNKVIPSKFFNSQDTHQDKMPKSNLNNSSDLIDGTMIDTLVGFVDEMNLKTSQILLKLEVNNKCNSRSSKSDISLCLSKLMLKFSSVRKKQKHRLYDSKDVVSEIDFISKIKDLMIKTTYQSMESKILMKPWSFTTEINLLWLQWRKEPYINIKSYSEVLQLDIGPENLLCLHDVYNYIEIGLSQFFSTGKKPKEIRKEEYLKGELYSDLYSQDDLRAGIFEYVTVSVSGNRNTFPQPYQVVCDKTSGLMAWCYPQPRALVKLEVYPVPLSSLKESLSSTCKTQELEPILCFLQYYDPLRELFVTYERFYLSESEFSHLDLPTVHEERLIAVSTVWRICISCEENSVKRKENSSVISPEVLGACVKVDSLFSVNILPTMEVYFNINKIYVTLQNHSNLTGKKLPPVIDKYLIDNTFPKTQPFLTTSLGNMHIRTNSKAKGNRLEAEFQFSLYILNFKYLIDNAFLEPAQFSLIINQQEAGENDKPENLDINITNKVLYMHVNQSSVHTLMICNELWKQAFLHLNKPQYVSTSSYGSMVPLLLMTNYVLINDTREVIRFGQLNTNENLVLDPYSLHFYAWRSQKCPAKLHISSKTSKWKWSEGFVLDSEGSEVLVAKRPNGHEVRFLIIRKMLSPIQMSISFCGFFSFGNYLLEDLEILIVENTPQEDWRRDAKSIILKTNADAKKIILKTNSISPSFLEEIHSFKIRYSSYSAWYNVPFVQITGQSSLSISIPKDGQYTYVSCKIFKEKVGSFWRKFIVFSPNIVIRSHLPRSMTLFAHTPSTDSHQQVTVEGRGNSQFLNCDPTQMHLLTFRLTPDLKVSKPPVQITKNLIDQVKCNSHEEKIDLSSMMENMFKGLNDKWPYIDSWDIEGDFQICDQPEINLQIDFSKDLYNLSKLVIDVRPWMLIVNQTGIVIILQEEESKKTWYILPDKVYAPPKIKSLFSLGTVSLAKKYFTVPLQISTEERWYTPSVEGKIPKFGSTNLKIFLPDKVIFFTVQSRYEENIQIFHLVPTYSISNNTVNVMSIRGLCANTSTEKVSVPDSSSVKEIPPPKYANSLKVQEHPVVVWDIADDSCSSSNEKDYMFMQIGSKSFFSFPFNLICENKDRRISVTVPLDSKEDISNEPYIVTVHPVGNRFKLVLQEDPCPQMIIHNNTSEYLFIGQESLTFPGTVEEEVNMFPSIPSVDPFRSIYYTFPNTSEAFPRNSVADIKRPKLHLASADFILNGKSSEIIWSHGLNIYELYDQFVNIPGYNDVKVHIENIGFSFHVFIDLVNRVEISAKDIRSRISSPPVKLPANDNKEKEKHPSVPCKVEGTDRSKMDTPKEIVVKNGNNLMSYITFISSEINIIIKRDVNVEHTAHEVIRLSFNNFVISVRPKINFSEKLRVYNFNSRNQMEIIMFFKDAQIDNQMFSEGIFDFPVVLIRQNLKSLVSDTLPLYPIERMVQLAYNDALFSFSMVIEKNADSFIRSINVRVKPISAYIEDKLIYFILEYIKTILDISCERSRSSELETSGSGIHVTATLPWEVLNKSNLMVSPLQIGSIHIDDISVLLSVHASIKLYIAVDQSPLQFAQFNASHVMTTYYSLGQTLALHYLSSALFKAGWVVTSLDLLGNPVGFARTVSLGLKDFIQLPIEGIFQGPWAFIAGITYGSLSLAKHLTTGTLVSVTNLANSVARNMDLLSLNEDDMMRNEANRRRKANGVTGSVLQGLSSFGISLLGAIGGIAHEPIQVILSERVSPTSFVGSFGTGLVGAVTKSLGGAANFFVHTGQGLLQGAGWTQDLDRKAYPVKEHFSEAASSSLKIVWKFLVDLPEECRTILCAAEGTLLASPSSYIPIILVLTSQVVLIIDLKTDSQCHSYSLHDLKWKCHPNDPTALYLKKVAPAVMVINDDGEPISGCPERVADYVMSTYSEGGVDGAVVDSNAFEEEFRGDDDEPVVKIFLSSQLRSFFSSCLEIASKSLKGRGFIS